MSIRLAARRFMDSVLDAFASAPLDDEAQAMVAVATLDQMLKDAGGAAEYVGHQGNMVRMTVTVPVALYARAREEHL